jgi:phage shock protein C
MYCTHCGRELADCARYCSGCGKPTLGTSPDRSTSLSRPRQGKLIAGVCAGVARHLEVDVTLVRIVWVLLTISPAVPGIILYVIFWIVMPKDPPRLTSDASPTGSEEAQVHG